MKIVLLSGRSGWRLWPLSNEARSKQFLQLLQNDDNERESMIQRMYRQIESAGLNSEVYVVTTASQADAIRNQIGTEIKIIVEPERRHTFPAIALATAFLAYNENASHDETVVVLPVDTFVDNKYFEQLACIDEAVSGNVADILLMGISPTYPSAKYGYILPGTELPAISKGTECLKVEQYIEKPTEEEAEEYLSRGAFWNAGVFGFKLGFLLDLIKSNYKCSSYDEFCYNYNLMPRVSFDCEILERQADMAVLPYTGKWKDLGTWNTLTEEMSEENIGIARQGEECENTHVINELSIPVLVLGAKNMVVAASPDGILVSDKHKSSYIKPYVQEVGNRPMYEERRWGEYKVLDYNQYDDGNKSLTKHLTIRAGKGISYQKHNHRDEIWTIVDGVGELLIDGHVRNVRRGDVAYIVKGQLHAMRAITDLQFIEVQIGAELAEEDIERFEWDW